MVKIIVYLPTILLDWITLLSPFSRICYKPSDENEREMSQYMRNKVRLAKYHTKRTLIGRK